MTRIIAGLAGGRRLRVPPSGTRPTSDRVREALFSMLDARMDLEGASVLDLYAGSGALGLEALSRGASHVVLVESDAAAARVVSSNVETTALPGASVRRVPVEAVVGSRADREFDLVLADPPYGVDDTVVHEVLISLRTNGWVGEGSLVVLERSSRSPETVWPDGFEGRKGKKYGEARIELATCYGRDS